jgi:hypothetical protein
LITSVSTFTQISHAQTYQFKIAFPSNSSFADPDKTVVVQLVRLAAEVGRNYRAEAFQVVRTKSGTFSNVGLMSKFFAQTK